MGGAILPEGSLARRALNQRKRVGQPGRQIEEQAAHIAAEGEALARQRVALEQRQVGGGPIAAPRPPEPPEPAGSDAAPAEPEPALPAELAFLDTPALPSPGSNEPEAFETETASSDEAAREHREAEEPDHAQDLAGRLTDRLIELHHSDLVRRRWRIVIVAMSLLAFLGILAAVAVFVARQG